MIILPEFDCVYATREYDNFHEGLDDVEQDDVEIALYKLENGNTGIVKKLPGGLYEIRLYSELRVYFSFVDTIILLLWGGKHKKRQSNDIKLAHKYLKNYKEVYHDGIPRLDATQTGRQGKVYTVV